MDTRGSRDISTSLKRQAFKLRDECDFEGMSANAILMTSSYIQKWIWTGLSSWQGAKAV